MVKKVSLPVPLEIISDADRFEWVKTHPSLFAEIAEKRKDHDLNDFIDNEISSERAAARVTKAEASQLIEDKRSLINVLYKEISALAVRHQIYVYTEGPAGYGTGAHVALEDKNDSWDSWNAGEWISSSRGC